MKTVKTLNTYTSISDGIKTIENLSNTFLKENKRRETVELTLTVMSGSAFDRSKKRIYSGPEQVEVRCWYDDAKIEQVSEMEWFFNNI